LFALQTAGENGSHYLLYKQQVKIGHLFALQTAGENRSHYLLYKQQV
jgi:hypothetical protein